MIELVLRFKAVAHFYIFIVITALCVVRAYRAEKQKKPVSFWPAIWVNFALFVAWGFLSELNHDDVAFLHFSWLISDGQVPFRDFWEHHSPILPVLLSPFLKIAPRSPAIFDMARIFSGMIFAINCVLGWRISKQVWKERADLAVYLLIVSAAGIFAQYLLLRPDLFMIMLMLAGVSFCLEIPRKGARPCFWAGIAFGMAVSFIAKHYLMVFLPVIAVLLHGRRGRIASLAAYACGFLAGIAPLVYYLASAGIWQEFLRWCVGFNARALRVAVHFPVVILCAGVWGAYVLLRRFKSSGDMNAVLLCSAFCLSSLSSLTTTSTLDGLYYLGLWYFLCAIAASGALIPGSAARIPAIWARALVIGLVCGALVAPNAAYIWKYKDGDYARGKKAAGELMRYALSDTCVILLPVHPVFVKDATRLYSGWQYFFSAIFPEVRDDIRRHGFAGKIMALRPAVVQSRYGRKDFILELYQKKVITSAEYKQLAAFLIAHYRKVQIGSDIYFVLKAF